MQGHNMPFAVVLAAAVILSGCAPGPAPAGNKADPREQASAAISAMVTAYQSNRAEAFFRNFDPDFVPNFAKYRDDVRQFLLNNSQFNIDVIIDSVLVTGDQTAVKFHWNRAYVNQTGAHVKDNGSCEFIFRARPPKERQLLITIHGTSPF